MIKYVSIVFLFCVGLSCKKDNSAPVNMGYQYFPINEGHYTVYDVIDILHDDVVGVHDTNTFQIKELVGESFIDEEGDEARELKRYQRVDSTYNWLIKDVWVIKLTGRTAEVVEENKRRIKMGFAISYEQYWDGNVLNNEEKEDCYYTKITDPFIVDNGTVIDSTTIVEHADFLTFIDYNRHFEVYAANIGKIYSVKKFLEINNSDTLDIIKGTELFYSLIDYGN
jgi:hypothetical protein